MASDTNAKAPGKILWLGGYSVLERPNLSFTSTVDAYVTAEFKDASSSVVELSAPQLNASLKGRLSKESGRIDAKAPEAMLLMKTSAEVALGYATGLGIKTSGFRLTTRSDSPFAYSSSSGKIVKSGLGSSAAVAVSTISAILQAHGLDPEENESLHKLAQAAHSIATGKVGSGFDIAASTFGSIIYSRFSPEILGIFPADWSPDQLVSLVKLKWDYKAERFGIPENLNLLFANFGESMITRGAIGGVSKFKESDPEKYWELIHAINYQNLRAIDGLRRMNAGEDDAMAEFRHSFDRGRILTKLLGEFSSVGIEPNDCTRLIEESKMNGAFVAKLPGAGGKDAIAALSQGLGERDRLKKFWSGKKELNILDIRISGKGALESPAKARDST